MNKRERIPEKQRTLKDIARISGMGAFSGDMISVEIHPAPVDSGLSFVLMLDGSEYVIPVKVKNIIEAENMTALGFPGDPSKQIKIVEHVLGALHGLRVDNAVIRVDSTEMPLMDGSALPYISAMDNVGFVEQDIPRRELEVMEPVFIDDGPVLIAVPYHGTRITYYLDHPDDVVGKRVADIDVSPNTFRRRIGPARTFIKEEKAQGLLNDDSVKNKDISQVLIVGADHLSQPLRFANEYCYHKMLDIMGDLYLAGWHLRGHIIGIRSGHFQNRKMIRKLVKLFG
ncbi:MAG TPA: hypothetical protein ENN67_02645 [Firmicutes bacterium]|nr:hypothetical protein [Bacillota bacterium]